MQKIHLYFPDDEPSFRHGNLAMVGLPEELLDIIRAVTGHRQGPSLLSP
ncbi:MAG: hypothetical protein ACREXX_08575 [Gammaproteobacteria bacterium]